MKLRNAFLAPTAALMLLTLVAPMAIIAVYSFLTTADDIIGVVVSDAVTGRFHTGTNWTALNDKTSSNAWFKLEMK